MRLSYPIWEVGNNFAKNKRVDLRVDLKLSNHINFVLIAKAEPLERLEQQRFS